jgi:Exopolysaccharide biosynthesis protein YbjH
LGFLKRWLCHLFLCFYTPLSANRQVASRYVKTAFITKTHFLRVAEVGALSFSLITAATAQQAYNGTSGYINTPSAQMREDGMVVVGASYAAPYGMLYVAVQALPRLELSGRYSQTEGVPSSINPGVDSSGYGSYKDKSFAAKFQLWSEGAGGMAWVPAVALGQDDEWIGTEVFADHYVVASKKLPLWGGNLDVSLGYGAKRIQGAFGGLRYTHDALPGWAWVTDYDRIDFRNDFGANLVGLDQRPVGRLNHAVEYQGAEGWTLQLGMRDGQPAFNVALQVPFGRRSLAPKTQEPAPYISFEPRSDEGQWQKQDADREQMLKALYQAGFRNVSVHYQNQVLQTTLTSNRYIDATRAVGRAMRILLAHSPVQTKELDVTYTTQEMPTLHYVAKDLTLLQAYFNGGVTLQTLQPSIRVEIAAHGGQQLVTDLPTLERVLGDQPLSEIPDGMQTSLPLDKRLSGETLQGHTWTVGPQMEVYFNDPSGAFKASLGVEAAAQLHLAPGMQLDTAVQMRLLENITDVTQPSNSLLPHVRTDVAEYFRGSRTKLSKLVLNQYWQPAPQWYTRVSAGLYETMFAGAGGQIMFVPQRAPWSVDVTLDRLAQRDFAAPLELQEYRTTSGFLSGHVELPSNITATLRYGRFLAQDTGARFELKRELPSGVQMGFWYSSTNGQDTTGPGSVAQPYHDKGIFLTLPLDVVSNQYSRRMVNMSLSPWTRDVGQMVKSPGDLRLLLERGMLRTLQNPAPLHSLGGVDAED